MAKKKSTKKLSDVTWVIGLVSGNLRARSYAVAHAARGGKLVCGRSRTVKWAGYKKRRIVSFAKPAPYERLCKRCLDVLHPPVRKKKR